MGRPGVAEKYRKMVNHGGGGGRLRWPNLGVSSSGSP